MLQTPLEDLAKGYTDYPTLSREQHAEPESGPGCSRQHCKAAPPAEGTPRTALLGSAY